MRVYCGIHAACSCVHDYKCSTRGAYTCLCGPWGLGHVVLVTLHSWQGSGPLHGLESHWPTGRNAVHTGSAFGCAFAVVH